MPTTYTPSPSTALPGEVVGAPVAHLPWIFVCTAGEVFCGSIWVASTVRQVAEKAAEKRRHEQNCNGGLIVVRH